MAQSPRRAPARRVPAGPANLSRGSGAPAPTSAAATEPMLGAHGGAPASGFYSPEPARESPAPTSGLDAAAENFNASVRRDHQGDGEHGGTADVAVVERAVAEENTSPEDLAADIARIRAFRLPLGAFSQKLALPKRAGYHRHWFNDVAGRIDEASANGWAHVLGKDKKPIARCVGSGRDKGALYAFAMELPEVFWQEDQDAKNQAAEDRIDQTRRSVAKLAPGERANPADKGKFYDPSESDTPVQIRKG